MASRFDVVSRTARGVDIVLGLRQHVGREVARIAIGGDDEDFGGAGDEVDPDLAGEQLLRGGDEQSGNGRTYLLVQLRIANDSNLAEKVGDLFDVYKLHEQKLREAFRDNVLENVLETV